ncbi:MAG: hypothetical protein M1358_06570 [Chloroflexi bacterium]|nr:hypothetical protein [Chloroflexota bacterium]
MVSGIPSPLVELQRRAGVCPTQAYDCLSHLVVAGVISHHPCFHSKLLDPHVDGLQTELEVIWYLILQLEQCNNITEIERGDLRPDLKDDLQFFVMLGNFARPPPDPRLPALRPHPRCQRP